MSPSRVRRTTAPAGSEARAGAAKKPAARPGATKRKRAKPSPQQAARTWARALERKRPGIIPFVLAGLDELYGYPVWQRRNDPTSELVLTILSQNSADINAEAAFASLRAAYPSEPITAEQLAAALPHYDPGWGGKGLPDLPPPDWDAVEHAPLPELVRVIQPGGLANQKAPRVQAALSAVRAAAGAYSLEFLGEMPALEARNWLAAIPGIGPKTASVVLLFSFGTPLMPVDRHVERVSRRIGLLPPKATADQAHDLYLAMLEPDQMYEAHVGMIRHGRETCHARKPECGRCPIAPRCRYLDSKAP